MPASSSSSSIHTLSPHTPNPSPLIMKPQAKEPKKVVVSNNNNGEVVMIRYGECRKNHAARIGGYAVDGCREFMASGEEGTSAALLCAACGCHRSFHKREVEAEDACDCSSVSGTSSQR